MVRVYCPQGRSLVSLTHAIDYTSIFSLFFVAGLVWILSSTRTPLRVLEKYSTRHSSTQAQLQHNPLRPTVSQATTRDGPLTLVAPNKFDHTVLLEDRTLPSLPLSPIQPLSLSNEQKEILERVLRGESVFFTGSAGTVMTISVLVADLSNIL